MMVERTLPWNAHKAFYEPTGHNAMPLTLFTASAPTAPTANLLALWHSTRGPGRPGSSLPSSTLLIVPQNAALSTAAKGNRLSQLPTQDFVRICEPVTAIQGILGDNGTVAISSFAAIGVDEISFNTGTDDVDEVRRLADIVS